MATYVLPQVLVFQDFNVVPVTAANPLSAHIAGGHAHLVRQSQSDERALGRLGFYDNVSDTPYLWPGRPAGSVIDQSYTKLFVENALLQYFTDDLSTGSQITKVANYSNRIRSGSVNFAVNGSYARNANLYDRDVKIGDVIKVRGVPTGVDSTGQPVTLWTYVKDLIPNEVPASIGTATTSASNADTSVCSHAVSQTGGPENCITASVFGCVYDGTPDGHTSETYVIQVIESSINGDHTTARLRVISGSGTDDQASVTPAAAGNPTAIGTRGLTVTFNHSDTAACSLSATLDGVSADDLIAGQEFTATVTQAFTATTATSGGSYGLTQDTTYIITVTKGGAFASYPEISVTTTNGTDQSGPHIVTNTGVNVTIGTQSVTIQFGASTHLNKGDRFYIPITGVGSGPIRTIVLGHNLDSTYANGDEVGIELYIRKPLLEVSRNRTNMAPLTNYDQSATEITVNSGMVAYDASWTNGGTPLPLDVYSASELNYGVLYVEYRAWLATLTSQINALTDVSGIDAISGALTPDNPLKWGVYKALTNNNGTPVLYTAVANPDDVDDWTAMLEILTQRDDVYNLVPLTRDPAVLGLYQAHVNANSSPTEGLWRVAWFNLSGIPEIPVISAGSTVPNHTTATTVDGNPALAVFEDDPLTSGSQYTICRVTAGNVEFVTAGVRAGDIVRALYSGDGFGKFTYSEFVVDEVQSENQLRVAVGPNAPQAIPAKIEIWRNLSATEEAQEIALAAGAYNNRRIRATWPETVESSGTLQEGYFLNCAVGALASGVLPQQGLTNVAINGFSSVSRTKFNKAQLDILASAGVWIVTQAIDGTIYTRQALTTGDYENINQREEMLTRNVDSISYRFKDYFAPYIGITNVTPTMQQIINTGLNDLISTLQVERATLQLGGQLITATVDQFYASTVFRDRYVVYVTLTVPYALNNIELHLVV